MDEVSSKLPIAQFTLKDYLASEVTQTRVLIAIKAALDSIGARKRLGCAISNEKAATVLTAVVLEALAPQLPPDGPSGGEEVPSEEAKAA